ncbi:hypothetical protein BH10CYA1_BH10CYA1_62200 [soil metagenome]
MLEAGGDINSSLSCISEVHSRLLESVAAGFTYTNVSDIQSNALFDQMIKQQIISADGKVIHHKIRADREIHMIQLGTAGGALRKFDYLVSAKTITIVHLLKASYDSFSIGNLQVAFMCLRNVMEHVAVFNSLIDDVAKYIVPATFEDAGEILKEIDNHVARKLYGRRVNWTALMTEPVDELFNKGKKALAYDASVARFDLTAEQILNQVDQLGKKVSGSRAVYDVLSEFVHPNVGALFSIMSSSQFVHDKSGVIWIETKIGIEPPTFMSREIGALLIEILRRIAECLKHFEKLLEASQAQRVIIMQTSQVILRKLLLIRGLLDPYSICPCGSKVKTKFCCSKVD